MESINVLFEHNEIQRHKVHLMRLHIGVPLCAIKLGRFYTAVDGDTGMSFSTLPLETAEASINEAIMAIDSVWKDEQHAKDRRSPYKRINP